MHTNPAYVFDGYAKALERELQLAEVVRSVSNTRGKKLQIKAVLFSEDAGSRLYTRLKIAAAQRVGIDYAATEFSLQDEPSRVVAFLQELAKDDQTTGVIVQKPWRQTWLQLQKNTSDTQDFSTWWSEITAAIDPKQDVDGLSPVTLQTILAGNWLESGHVLPATCKAVLTIVDEAEAKANCKLESARVVIVGRSQLLGIPLAAVLRQKNVSCDLLGKSDFNAKIESPGKLSEYDVVVTATGRKNLVTGDMLRENVVVIDAGEPSADVDWATVAPKSSFITPVPGGVGPMTVVSLLENCVDLAQLSFQI